MGTLVVTLVIAFATCTYVGATLALFWITRRSIRLQAQHDLWKEWWSLEETASWRYSVFNLFVPDYWANLVNDDSISLKNLSESLPQEWCDHPRRLAWWFDQVGCLAAQRLVEADFILVPMQHLVKRTWWVLKPFIDRARRSDPLYCYGLQWLYDESVRRPQWERIKATWKNPPSDLLKPAFRESMEEREREFLDLLDRLRMGDRIPTSEIRGAGTDWDPSVYSSWGGRP